ncbi:MAG TPA: hypothetical protein VIB48_12225 [Acidimicrobiia bacterium]|jgi:hypothetical protein
MWRSTTARHDASEPPIPVRECTHRIGPVVVLHTDGYVGARCAACGVTLSQWLGEFRDGLYVELRGLVEDVKHHLHRVHADTDDKSLAALHACAARVPTRSPSAPSRSRNLRHALHG